MTGWINTKPNADVAFKFMIFIFFIYFFNSQRTALCIGETISVLILFDSPPHLLQVVLSTDLALFNNHLDSTIIH